MQLRIFGLEDENSGHDRPLWQGLSVDAERIRGPRPFGWAPSLDRRLASGGLDLVHAHGIWMYPSIASLRWARRARRPYIVSPHGMLDGWALAQSHWKKRLAGALFENRHLAGAACLHALTRAEARSIRQYGLKNPICVIPNGVEIPARPVTADPPWAEEAGPGARVLLYLGRLHAKKGLIPLLVAWAQCRFAAAARPWKLVIAGGDDGDGYADGLRRLTRALAIQDSVIFAGPLYGAQKAASLARASALALPSASEGLPLAVLEAWASGVPVLMTPECNLPEGFDAGAALRVAAPGPIEIRNALERLFWTSPAHLVAMGARGRELAERHFSWDAVAREMKRVYEWVLGRGEKPASVMLT
jgi:poly(glycerol-phosphate) alpha-glucosyltransferase